jgi:hypothetical protein
MFNLIKLIIGLFLFLIGVSLSPTLFSLFLTMIGSFIISRPIALDSAFGNTPFLFLIGILFFIPSFYSSKEFFNFFEMNGSVIRITLCLVTGVLTWLSISKN